MASLALCNPSAAREYFLRRPPLPFDLGLVGRERSSDDTDEDWLSEVTDIVSGNFHVMVDLTGDSDDEVCHQAATNHDYPER